MRLQNAIMLACSILAIQGCGMGWFVDPMQQPIIEDKLGESGFRTLSTTSSRRVVIFDQNKKKICAEPPPDVADNLTSAFVTALQGTDGSVEAKAELSKSFASTAKQLFQRTQGLQLYRDGMYSYCQLYLNGAIDITTLLTKQDDLLKIADKLIQLEIGVLPPKNADNVSAQVLPHIPKSKEAGNESLTTDQNK